MPLSIINIYPQTKKNKIHINNWCRELTFNKFHIFSNWQESISKIKIS